MNFRQSEREPAGNITGIAFVAVLPAFIVYALFIRLARKVVEMDSTLFFPSVSAGHKSAGTFFNLDDLI